MNHLNQAYAYKSPAGKRWHYSLHANLSTDVTEYLSEQPSDTLLILGPDLPSRLLDKTVGRTPAEGEYQIIDSASLKSDRQSFIKWKVENDETVGTVEVDGVPNVFYVISRDLILTGAMVTSRAPFFSLADAKRDAEIAFRRLREGLAKLA